MTKCIVKMLLPLLLAVIGSLSCRPSAEAATGDFLFQWGTPHVFSSPKGVALDGGGNLYVTENHRVQVFDGAGNLIRSWGSYGTGKGEFAFPCSVAVSGNRVFVCDAGNNRIQLFDSAGNHLKTLGGLGSGNGSFRYPQGIATDRDGDLYVADSDNSRVQVFDGNGGFLRSFGSRGGGNGQFMVPTDLAVDGVGKVYVVDDNNRVQLFDGKGNFLRSWRTLGAPGFAQWVALDNAGNLYVTLSPFGDMPPYAVEVFDNGGHFLREWGGFGFEQGRFFGLGDLSVDAGGNVYVADPGNDRVQVFDGGGKYLRKVGGGDALSQFRHPVGVASDAVGNIYLTDTLNYRVQVFDGTGNFLRKFGSFGAGTGQFAEPGGLAVDRAGNVYVSDAGADRVGHRDSRVQLFDSGGNFLSSWGLPTGSDPPSPRGVALDSSGNVYVADRGNNRIYVFGSDGILNGAWGSLGTGDGELWSPNGLAVDAFGKVYVVDQGNHRIQVFDGSGKFLRKWGSQGGGDGQFLDPLWIALDAAGHVYVTDRDPSSGKSCVQVFDSAGKFLAKWGRYGSGSGQFLGAQGIAAGGGRVYVADSNNDRVQAFVGFDGTEAASGPPNPGPEKGAPAGPAAVVDGTLAPLQFGDDFPGNGESPCYVCRPVSGANIKVSLAAPLEGASYNAPATVPITASATAGGETVKQVEFFAGGTPVGTAASAPYSVTWRNVAPGSYTLTAKVTDSLGGTGTSGPVAISVSSTLLPSPWATQDVGSVGQAGSASYLDGAFTLKGSGSDIWGTTDAFRLVYQPLTGDGQIVARVVSLQNTDSFAKAGVMIRQSLAANSMHAMMDFTAGNGAEFSRRMSTGGTTTATIRSGLAAPYWLKLVRSGNTFTGSVSADGANWEEVGSSTIGMTSTVYLGFAVTSRNNAALCTATLEGVGITVSVNSAR